MRKVSDSVLGRTVGSKVLQGGGGGALLCGMTVYLEKGEGV